MYNRKKYRLPKEVYMKVVWHCRDYQRMKDEYDSLFGRSPVMDGQPKGKDPGDPTGQLAIKSAELSEGIRAIEDALNDIPEEYRAGIMGNACYRKPFPDYAYPDTWRVYRQRFIFGVAVRLHIY